MQPKSQLAHQQILSTIIIYHITITKTNLREVYEKDLPYNIQFSLGCLVYFIYTNELLIKLTPLIIPLPHICTPLHLYQSPCNSW